MSKFITSDPPYNAGLYPTTDGFLELANGIALSSTLTNVTDQLNTASTLYLSTEQVKIGSVSNNTPLVLFGSQNVNAIISTANISGSEKTFTFPNSSLTFAGINIAQTFTAAQTFNSPSASGEDGAPIRILTNPWTSGNANQNHPLLLFGTHGGSIWAASPNGGTYIGINAVASFPGNFLDFHVNGGASVFKVAASGNVYIGANSSSTAKLNVKGEGTNNIVRFETSGIHQAFAINSNGAITIARDGNIGPQIYPFNASEVVQDILGFGLGFTSNKVNFATNNYDVFFSGQNIATTSGIANYVTIRRTFTAPAGTASFRPLNVEYTINNSGAQTGGATATGIFLNATETTLFGMTHNLMDLQVGGSSRFKVAGDGTTTFGMNSAILNLGGNAVATLNLGNGGTNFAVSGGVPSLNGVSATNSWLLINSSNANSRAIIQVCGSSAATTASIPNTSIGSAPGATIFYNSTTTNYVESFRIKGTGVINSPTLPSSNVGLSSGDWYYDTAANILANGDKILARKA